MTRTGGAWESRTGRVIMGGPAKSKLTREKQTSTVRAVETEARHRKGEASLAAKTLLECSFYIPTRRDKNLSDGKPHKRRAWKWLDNSLEVFGGVTEPTAPYRGWYLDRETGERVPDVSRKYIVAVPRWQVNDLRAV